MDTKELLETGGKHLMAFTKRAPIALVRGEGMRVWDSDGKEYLDFTGGIAVTALGHSHPEVVGTMREQATTLLHVSNLFHIPQQTHLAKLLCDHSFADRVFFSNSGAEANEAAIKLARKWAKEHGASDRGDIITMRGGFHGRTLATVTATAQEKYHHGFEPLPGGFKYVPFNDLRALERAIDSHTAGVMVEPIQGEGGVIIPDDGYLPGLRKLCDEAGVCLIFDEIQTGMGRTGRLWGYEHSGVAPDVMTVAKALANGVPIGATLATDEVASAFAPGTHGSTFGGNPLRHRGGPHRPHHADRGAPARAGRSHGAGAAGRAREAARQARRRRQGGAGARLPGRHRPGAAGGGRARARAGTAGSSSSPPATTPCASRPRSCSTRRTRRAASPSSTRRWPPWRDEALPLDPGSRARRRRAPLPAHRRSEVAHQGPRPRHAAGRPRDGAHLREAVAPHPRHVRGGDVAARRLRRLPGRPGDRIRQARVGARHRPQSLPLGGHHRRPRLRPRHGGGAVRARDGAHHQRAVGPRASLPGDGGLLHAVGAGARPRQDPARVDRRRQQRLPLRLAPRGAARDADGRRDAARLRAGAGHPRRVPSARRQGRPDDGGARRRRGRGRDLHRRRG